MHILPGRIRLRLKEIIGNPFIAERLRFILQREEAIRDVAVNTRTGSCLVLYDAKLPGKTIIDLIHRQLRSIDSSRYLKDNHKQAKQFKQNESLQKVMTGGAILTLFSLPAVAGKLPNTLTSAALITTGYPFFKRSFDYFRYHKKPNYQCMVLTLSILSALKGQGMLGLFTLWLSNLSEYLQHLTFRTASSSFSNILIKKGNRIALLKNNKIHHVLPGDVLPGDLVAFKAGDCIPLEGEILHGEGSGSPGEKLGPGGSVTAGMILEKGRIIVKVHRVVEDTSLARLADILDDAMENPQAGSDLALHYSERLLPITFLTTALVYGFTRDIQRTIPVLLAGAPGPAGLAAPTALSASTGLAAGMGIAVKESSALELLSNIDVVIFHNKDLAVQQGKLHPALRKLAEDGYQIEDFDPWQIHATDRENQNQEISPESTIARIQQKGLRVAWVSGPEHPLLVENADINILFLSGKEKKVAPAQVLCYRRDPRLVYRLIRLSRKTMHTIQENVFMVQGLNLLGQVLGGLGIIGSIPAVGLNLLTTLAVVFHSGHSLIGIGNKNYSPFETKGTIEGLAVDKGKCLLISKNPKHN